jgi:type 1 fimbria pilin
MKNGNIFITSAVAALLVAAGNSVAAGPTATLQVKGTITPAACTPTLANNGIVDFGATSVSELTEGADLKLKSKIITLSVTCTGLTKLSFTVSDNRVATINPDTQTPYGKNRISSFGLGDTTDSAHIGVYTIKPKTVSASPNLDAIDIITSVSGSSWTRRADSYDLAIDRMGSGGTDSVVTIAREGELTPAEFTDMTMDIEITPYLSKEMKLSPKFKTWMVMPRLVSIICDMVAA